MWYTTWFGTPYYKLLYGHRDDVEARNWVQAIVARLGLRDGHAVLDMACGRGRHAQWFTNVGANVTGIDLSAESITEARAGCPGATFHVHDMREPMARSTFDLAVCLFTSLGYSADRNDDQRAVNAAAVALKPGGWFVLDLMNSERVCRELVEQEHLEVEGVVFDIERAMEDGAIVKRIHVHDGENDLRFVERVHAFTPASIEGMVERVRTAHLRPH